MAQPNPDPIPLGRLSTNGRPTGPRPRRPDPYADDNVSPEREPRATKTELKSFDVFALIVNNIIGTGVYTSPATVYRLTGDKRIALGLWFVGFAYTILSMGLYLDYAAALPYTGGELLYLEEITAFSGRNIHLLPPIGRIRKFFRKLLGDGLLAYVVYSILFVSVFNSSTNTMQFGRQILLAIQADQTSTAVNRDLLRLIGVVAFSALCLMQFASPTAGRALNAWWAVIKIGFVIGLIGVGGYAATHSEKEPLAWDHAEDSSKTSWDIAKAMLNLLFAFEGWENATFVAGEIPRRNHHILRRGFMAAVGVVGVLYVSVAAVFLRAKNIDDLSNVASIAPLLSGNTPAVKRLWAIFAAISALGSLNSIVYTFSRVKQSIGQANILPWSRLWGRDHIVRNSADEVTDTSPLGGLLLHWLTTVIIISAMSSVKNTSESISFPGYLQVYTHALILFTLTLTYFWLPGREFALGNRTPTFFRPSQAKGFWKVVVVCVAVVYLALNCFLIGAAPASGLSSDGAADSVPGKVYPAVVFGVVAFGLLYYFSVFGSAAIFLSVPPHNGDLDAGGGAQPGTNEHAVMEIDGLLPRDSKASLLRLAHVRAEVRKDLVYRNGLERVERFGRRWRVRTVVNRYRRHAGAVGRGPAHNDQDYADGSSVGSVNETEPLNFLYWAFGGRRWIVKTPWKRTVDYCRDKIGVPFGRVKELYKDLFRRR